MEDDTEPAATPATQRSLAVVLLWAMRAAWAVLPLVAGPAFDAALADRSRTVQVVDSTGLWIVWAAGLAWSLVRNPVGLTGLRLIAPLGVVAAAVAGLCGAGLGATAGALGATAIAAALAFAPETGTTFVNGPAYGDERRFLLRAPGPLLLGPIQVAWAAAMLAPAAALASLAAGAFVPAVLLAVVGIPGAYVGTRSLHALAERWVVFVPAGLVLKDPLTLIDPVLFKRQEVEVLQPAPADSDSLDLTMGSPGLALELLLLEKVPMILVKAKERAGEEGRSARLLFTPTRAGAVLAEARKRRLAPR